MVLGFNCGFITMQGCKSVKWKIPKEKILKKKKENKHGLNFYKSKIPKWDHDK